MPRVIWKGAISFGLVHIPVALHAASRETGIDFDWLDKRSMDPVGYRRINKRTGKEIKTDDIVKGIKQDDGDYVVLSDDEIKAAYPRTTQTIEIEAFVKGVDVPFFMLERPYSLAPIGKGEKVYQLLREAMREAGVIGIARVVMHTKEHLAALVPAGPALMLNTLRWHKELLGTEDLSLPPEGKGQIKAPEMKMARQLIDEMTQPWQPEDYEDTFAEAIGKLVQEKRDAGETEQVKPLEDAPESARSSNVVDLTELLAQSLRKRPSAKSADKSDDAGDKKAPAKSASRKSASSSSSRTAKSRAPARKRA
jgi:DNA end-binding protein Ku